MAKLFRPPLFFALGLAGVAASVLTYMQGGNTDEMDAALCVSFGLIAAAFLVGAAILRAAERAHPTERPPNADGR